MTSDAKLIGYLESGIKTETLRQSAIANNIANMNTPGYRRVDVKFSDVLADKINNDEMVEPENDQAHLYQPCNTAVNDQGNDVSLDVEVGEMVKNSLQHKTYTRLLARTYRQLDLAINLSK